MLTGRIVALCSPTMRFHLCGCTWTTRPMKRSLHATPYPTPAAERTPISETPGRTPYNPHGESHNHRGSLFAKRKLTWR